MVAVPFACFVGCAAHSGVPPVKIADFGVAKTLGFEGLKTYCGSPQYFAPEVLRRRDTVCGNGRYGKGADMWSLGALALVTRCLARA
jgi:serine/threonine protein kinase